MTTAANVANFNGQKPVIDPSDAVMLLIDHQSGLFQTVADMPMLFCATMPPHSPGWRR